MLGVRPSFSAQPVIASMIFCFVMRLLLNLWWRSIWVQKNVWSTAALGCGVFWLQPKKHVCLSLTDKFLDLRGTIFRARFPITAMSRDYGDFPIFDVSTQSVAQTMGRL
jgi:hypothetical protein